MAIVPNYEAVKRHGSLIIDNDMGTALSDAVFAGALTNSRVHKIRVNSGPTTAPGSTTLYVILDDGELQTIFDIVTIQSIASFQQADLDYDDLFLYSPDVSIKFQVGTAVPAGATLHCVVFGSDY